MYAKTCRLITKNTHSDLNYKVGQKWFAIACVVITEEHLERFELQLLGTFSLNN